MTNQKSIYTAIQTSLVISLLLLLGACGAATTTMVDPALNLAPTKFQTTVNHWPENHKQDLDFMKVYDPWEPMNRHLYNFNAGLDNAILLPATTVYETVLPSPVRSGVSNVIQNLNEIPVFINCLLQGKLKKTAITTSRFFINTTFGIGGLMDLAKKNKKLQLQDEDFGQTLGVWGVGDGPYFVMPIFGPSNLRDTFGFGGDFLLMLMQMKYTYKALGIKDTKTIAYTELVIRALNRRSNISFRYHETGSPFEYELIRFIYTKKRELDIMH